MLHAYLAFYFLSFHLQDGRDSENLSMMKILMFLCLGVISSSCKYSGEHMRNESNYNASLSSLTMWSKIMHETIFVRRFSYTEWRTGTYTENFKSFLDLPMLATPKNGIIPYFSFPQVNWIAGSTPFSSPNKSNELDGVDTERQSYLIRNTAFSPTYIFVRARAPYPLQTLILLHFRLNS